MPPSNDEELGPSGRTVAEVQRAASTMLCVLAAGAASYTAVHGVWLLTALFCVGLALAVQSHRVAADPDGVVEIAAAER